MFGNATPPPTPFRPRRPRDLRRERDRQSLRQRDALRDVARQWKQRKQRRQPGIQLARLTMHRPR